MHLHKLTVGPFSENTYLLIKEEAALLVDPGFHEEHEFNRFLEILNSSTERVELSAVILTHAHVDHVLGLNRVLKSFDVPVYLSDRDRYLWDNMVSQALLFGLHTEPIDITPEPFSRKGNWSSGPFSFDVRYTPGHAPDHVVFYSEEDELVIAGDTLFREGIGRYDLYRGDFHVLEDSIREQLYTLPSSTRLYPGHGPETTIEYEKLNNPYVRQQGG